MDDDGMLYAAFPDGSIRGVSSTPQEGVTQPLPEGATALTRDQFVVLKQQAKQAIADRHAELLAGDAVRQETDYRAMLAVSLPEDLARRLSGYGGELVDG